ncbi:MAG TPA: DoxX family protein [Vicinamibacterales bacterium]|nr:DoxX family protein [Vicinamibacterales bacterium]
MNVVLWILQILLAVAFLAHSWLMLAPPASVAVQMNAALPARWFQIFIGVAELLAAIGLTLPGITRIRPSLVAWAAAGLMVLMICATVFHLTRGEIGSAATTAVLLALTAFVAYGRWRIRPIPPRTHA